MHEGSLIVTNLCVERAKRKILRDINFEATPGRILAILGPNGAGKTTLLKACIRLLPFEGSIELHKRDLSQFSRLELAQGLAYVPQRSLLRSPLNVETVVRQGHYIHQQRPKIGAHEAMRRVDVEHLAARPFTKLSGGEQRRVLLARAIATGAEYLLLDEPTASLDIAHALSFFSLIRTLANDGYGIIIVLHNLDEALRFTDDALLLNQGEIITRGPSPEVLSEAHIRQVYGVEIADHEGMRFQALQKGS